MCCFRLQRCHKTIGGAIGGPISVRGIHNAAQLPMHDRNNATTRASHYITPICLFYLGQSSVSALFVPGGRTRAGMSQ